MRHLIPFCTAGMMILSTASARADLGIELYKLTADNGAGGDRFGVAVAVSGDTAIVGASQDDDNGSESGSAYLFDIITGQQLLQLFPNDGAMGDEFGFSVGISDNVAIVGSWKNDDNGLSSGSAYLFDATTGEQLFKLVPDDSAALNQFGYSVAISGNVAIVGARHDADNGAQSGSAYLFNVTNGQQLYKLLPDDGATSDEFGFTVAISGNVAIVGARLDNDNGANSGSAYLFDATTGEQLHKLLSSDGVASDQFGYSVAISDTVAAVGAWQDDDNGDQSGSVYLFDIATGDQLLKLSPENGASGDRFGVSVAIDEQTVIGGALEQDTNGTNAGSAYSFDVTSGYQLAWFLPEDGAGGDEFGVSVSVSGRTAIIGANLDDDNGSSSGSAYLFDSRAVNSCPDTATVTAGLPIGGSAADVCEVDGAIWTIQSETFDAAFAPPPVAITFEGTVDPLARTNLTLCLVGGPEFGSNAAFIQLRMWNYSTGTYEGVPFINQADSDSTEFQVTNPISDFVGANGEVKAEITCAKTVFGPVRLRMDQVVWRVD